MEQSGDGDADDDHRLSDGGDADDEQEPEENEESPDPWQVQKPIDRVLLGKDSKDAAAVPLREQLPTLTVDQYIESFQTGDLDVLLDRLQSRPGTNRSRPGTNRQRMGSSSAVPPPAAGASVWGDLFAPVPPSPTSPSKPAVMLGPTAPLGGVPKGLPSLTSTLTSFRGGPSLASVSDTMRGTWNAESRGTGRSAYSTTDSWRKAFTSKGPTWMQGDLKGLPSVAPAAGSNFIRKVQDGGSSAHDARHRLPNMSQDNKDSASSPVSTAARQQPPPPTATNLGVICDQLERAEVAAASSMHWRSNVHVPVVSAANKRSPRKK
eukprot:gnl/TRDRNA2_/TRDRNA2_175507_c8_seq2.p2 gnl/TRDRNA2_/TRDRNA2_175507_c8~~gnl/TRDRNA2_/TRDRNA2_175507_c8_seq2.p2  ORF type:complete len:321 (+),score=61.45 gnl/TRDRNA2_/TRDRNA2_175507_c8_seq2:1631-2593(+)